MVICDLERLCVMTLCSLLFLQCVAVCCSMCSSVLQCVAVRCSVALCIDLLESFFF